MLFEKRSGFFIPENCKDSHVIHTLVNTAEFRSQNCHTEYLTTWVTVDHSSKCVVVLISMLGRVKNSHYSSCSQLNHQGVPRLLKTTSSYQRVPILLLFVQRREVSSL